MVSIPGLRSMVSVVPEVGGILAFFCSVRALYLPLLCVFLLPLQSYFFIVTGHSLTAAVAAGMWRRVM